MINYFKNIINYFENIINNTSTFNNNIVFNYNSFLKHFFIGSSISFLLWVLYLEINPKLRNIWIREDANSNLVFAPINIFNLILYSAKHIIFWYPPNWDMNCFIWIIFGTSIYLGFRYTIIG